MADQKVTTMVLKVDLQCPSCYKKIKKLLCKFPQIRDQAFDEKQNTVTITVVCCSPEKVRDKLCCKGGKTIESIEIKPPPKPPAPKPDPPKPAPTPAPKPDPPKPAPAPAPAPKPDPPKPAPAPAPVPVPAPAPAPAPAKKPAPPPTPAPAPAPVPTHGCPPPYPYMPCCRECYEGRPRGPCYHGERRLVPWYDNYGYGPPSGCGCGCGGVRGCRSGCDYFSEDNTSGCAIM